ncbi:hypothetical protein CPB86DRAFT_789947 [Serendipita vermifera]|nr:hypothetical protein CPB86DRAFT_789947 [Serendipita vermifera]
MDSLNFTISRDFREPAKSLLNVKTPRDTLTTLFDTLEISRLLFKHYHNFHCALDPRNILIRDTPASFDDRLTRGPEEVCFSQHLLDKDTPNGDDHFQCPNRCRLATKVCLVDFDYAESVGVLSAVSEGQKKRHTGTPMFMARRQRGLFLRRGIYELPAIPQVSQNLTEYYKRLFPERLDKFLPNEPKIVRILEEIKLEYDLYHLRYEAESLFWVLLFWCMTAQPNRQPEWEDTVDKRFCKTLPRSLWWTLIEAHDNRNNTFVLDFSKSCLHPAYSSFYGLLQEMRQQLILDPEFAENMLKREPEYLHEVMQRLIINFLVENADEAFMDLERSSKQREIDTPSNFGLY